MVFHPFLLAAYPILALMGQNAGEVRVASLSKLIGLVLLATLVIWLLLGIVLRDLRKAGVAASLAVVFFFTSDLVMGAADVSLSYASRYWVRTEIELGVAAAAIPEILMLAGVAYALKTRLKDARRLTLFLNLFAAALIAIPLAEIISTKTPSMARATRVPVPYPLAARPSSKHLPDIYYIILDGYAQ